MVSIYTTNYKINIASNGICSAVRSDLLSVGKELNSSHGQEQDEQDSLGRCTGCCRGARQSGPVHLSRYQSVVLHTLPGLVNCKSNYCLLSKFIKLYLILEYY